MVANKMNIAPAPLTAQCGFRRTGVTCASLCWSSSSRAFTTGRELSYPASASEEVPTDCPETPDARRRFETGFRSVTRSVTSCLLLY
jgi:hypothetical protein